MVSRLATAVGLAGLLLVLGLRPVFGLGVVARSAPAVIGLLTGGTSFSRALNNGSGAGRPSPGQGPSGQRREFPQRLEVGVGDRLIETNLPLHLA